MSATSRRAIGAQLELDRPGLCYFDATGLQRLHGGLDGVIAAAGKALRRRLRIGAGPTRFCALAAALTARTRRARVIGKREARTYLATQPVSVLRYRPETDLLVPALERLGIGTLGDLANLGAGPVSDRFAEAGTVARNLALAHDEPLRPRRVEDRVAESMKLADANSGLLLARTLEVLVDRLLARSERRGRTIRALILAARLVERGTWREHVALREAIADPERILLALGTRLALLPAPAVTPELAVAEFGPSTGDQRSLLDGERTVRDARRRRAVGQVRALAGPHALLRVLVVAPDSPVPEHRTLSTPWPA